MYYKISILYGKNGLLKTPRVYNNVGVEMDKGRDITCYGKKSIISSMSVVDIFLSGDHIRIRGLTNDKKYQEWILRNM